MNYDVVIIGAGPSGIAAGHNIINNKLYQVKNEYFTHS